MRHGLGVSKDSLTGSCDDGASLLEKLALGLQREENAMTGRKRHTCWRIWPATNGSDGEDLPRRIKGEVKAPLSLDHRIQSIL